MKTLEKLNALCAEHGCDMDVIYDGYWEDIGTIGSFFDANILLTNNIPPVNLYNSKFTYYTHSRSLPPTKFLEADISNSLIAEGGIINVSKIKLKEYITQKNYKYQKPKFKYIVKTT